MKDKVILSLICGIAALVVLGFLEDKKRYHQDDPLEKLFSEIEQNRRNLYHYDNAYNYDELIEEEFKKEKYENFYYEVASDEDCAPSDSIDRQYYDSGKIKSITEYRNELPHGGSTHYYENGKVKLETYYVNGVKDGEEAAYYSNGKQKHLKHYRRGEEYGKQEYYNTNGKKTKTEYKN